MSEPRNDSRAARWTFVALMAALLPAMVLASFDFGATWDEIDRHNYGMKVLEFLRGLRTRDTFRETGGHVYPGLFDTICAAAEEWAGMRRFVLRHVINAVFGWIGVVYCGRLAGRLFGPWAGVLAALLLAVSPRYFAASMNNPKDLPFAAMAIMALYYISLVSPRWPYVSFATGAKIAVAVALALNVRVGALLYVGYFGLLVLAFAAVERLTDARRLADTAVRLAVISLAVLLLGTVFWPWAGGAPLIRPFQALLGASGYPWDGIVLYAGEEYTAQTLPWHYAPWWFVISSPLVVLAGLLLSICCIEDRADGWRRAGLWFVAALPLAAAIIMESTLYDSVRHLMFVYPVLVVVAAGGWSGLFAAPRPPMVRLAAAGFLVVGVVGAAVENVRLHPNQGVYINSLEGGPGGAFRKYDLDYWGNCIFQAVQWASSTSQSFGKPVLISGHPAHLVHLNTLRLPGVHFTQASEDKHHMYVHLVRGTKAHIRSIERQPTLHAVDTPDGALLCTVVAGPAYLEFIEGTPAQSERRQ